MLLEGSGKPQPSPLDNGGSGGSNKDSVGGTAPATAEAAAATGSTPMLATTWDLLRSLLRQVLQRDAAAAGRARAMLEGWKACPDPQRQVCLLPKTNGGLNGVSRFVLSAGRAGGGRLTGEPPFRIQDTFSSYRGCISHPQPSSPTTLRRLSSLLRPPSLSQLWWRRRHRSRLCPKWPLLLSQLQCSQLRLLRGCGSRSPRQRRWDVLVAPCPAQPSPHGPALPCPACLLRSFFLPRCMCCTPQPFPLACQSDCPADVCSLLSSLPPGVCGVRPLADAPGDAGRPPP